MDRDEPTEYCQLISISAPAAAVLSANAEHGLKFVRWPFYTSCCLLVEMMS